MLSEAYVLKIPLMAVVNEETAHLIELPEGALFYAANAKPDSHGMIKGMCKGHMVMIFARDLAERAEPLANSKSLRSPGAAMVFTSAESADIDDHRHD